MSLLPSYVQGAWYTAPDEGRPLLDAVTGEEVARISSTGLDLAAMLDHARRVGGPALRALTFHERAGAAQGARPGTCASTRTSSTRSRPAPAPPLDDAMFDIDGGIGTLLAYAQQGHAASCPTTRSYSTAPSSRWAAAARSSASTSTPRVRGVAVQINAFNFPVWGLLEKLAPAFLAGVPTIVKPASQTAYLTERGWSADRRVRPAARGLAAAARRQRRRPARPAHRAGPRRLHRLGARPRASCAPTRSSCTAACGSAPRPTRSTARSSAPTSRPTTPEFDLFVKGVVTEMTVKAGQKCTAIRRAFVPEQHRRRRRRGVSATARRDHVGDPARRGRADGRAGQPRPARGGPQRRSRRCAASAELVFGDPEQVDVVGADAERGAFVSPMLLRRRRAARPSRTTSRRSARCSTVMPYDVAPRRRSRWPPAGRAAWPARSSPTTRRSPARSCSASRPGTAGILVLDRDDAQGVHRATARRCPCSCTAAPGAPAAARSSAASAACCTTCSAPRSRPTPTCSPRSPAAGWPGAQRHGRRTSTRSASASRSCGSATRSSPARAPSRRRTSSTSPSSPATRSTRTWTRRPPRRTRCSASASRTAT